MRYLEDLSSRQGLREVKSVQTVLWVPFPGMKKMPEEWWISQWLLGSTMDVLSLLDVPMSTESVCSRMTEAALPAPWTAGSSALEERAIRRESKVICENSPFSDLDGLGSWKSESHKPLRSTQTLFMSGWQVCRDAGQIAPMKLSLRPSMSLEVRH